MADKFAENKEMQRLTQKYVSALSKIWADIFDPTTCQQNLDKLVTHTKNYYKDLVSESLQKKGDIEKEIDDLYKEAETICRLLKTELQLPDVTSTHMPLLSVQLEMDKSLAELREKLRERREEICELLLDQESLCEELGEPPRPLVADPLPTETELAEFRAYLEELKLDRVQRISEMSTLRREIKMFLQTLDLQVGTEKEEYLLNERDIKLNRETFNELLKMSSRYRAQVQQMSDEIDGMRSKLDGLWTRLKVSPATRKKFKHYTECSQHTYDAYYGEVQRCEALKSQNIKQYVQQIRGELTEWWDRTLKSLKQRSRFTHFQSNCYTDDLLELHELELEDLKSFYNKNQQIFQLYSERKILWERMVALEAKAMDPSRYNNRGGQLLKEEKERKTIATKLPKIEQEIAKLVDVYMEREHESFLVNGENILDVISTEWDKKRQEKEKLSSARKNGQTPLSHSQLQPPGRTPLSLRNTSTATLRKAPSTTNLSTLKTGGGMTTAQKRKLNPSEKHTPSAKRSLMPALNSPSVFLRPLTLVSGSTQKNRQKTPVKKPPRVVGTTIRRRSSRLSNSGVKKQRSGVTKAVPVIHVNDASDGYTDDDGGATTGRANDTYDSFEKCIEPNSRSSTILCATKGVKARKKHLRSKVALVSSGNVIAAENTRRCKIPSSLRTPSRKILRHPDDPNLASVQHRTPPSHTSTSISGTASRKLTTKNLPILI